MTFENAKVGDRVWDIQYGYGIIISNTHTKDVPLYVKFDIGYDKHFILEGIRDGNSWESIKIPTLFWQKWEIPEVAYVKPLPNLEVDTKIYVSTKELPEVWHRRYFSHFEGDKVYCFDAGGTSWSTGAITKWSNWKLIEEK